jgi:hypothetical protein
MENYGGANISAKTIFSVYSEQKGKRKSYGMKWKQNESNLKSFWQMSFDTEKKYQLKLVFAINQNPSLASLLVSMIASRFGYRRKVISL